MSSFRSLCRIHFGTSSSSYLKSKAPINWTSVSRLKNSFLTTSGFVADFTCSVFHLDVLPDRVKLVHNVQLASAEASTV